MSFNSESILKCYESVVKQYKCDITQIDHNLGHSPQIDFRHRFETLYRNKQFVDFEFKFAGNEDSIKVHKIYLILNDCKSLETIVDNWVEVPKDVSKEWFQSIIDSIYSQNFDSIEVNDENINELIRICEELGNEWLWNRVIQLKERVELMAELDKIEDLFRNRKRKLESMETSNKRRKLTICLDPNLNDSNHSVSVPDLSSIDSVLGSEVQNELSDSLNLTSNSIAAKESNQTTTDLSEGLNDSENSFTGDLGSSGEQTICSDFSFEFNKYLTFGSKSDSTNVWKCCFVPKKCEQNVVKEDDVIAVIGGSLMNSYNLDKECQIVATFVAPKGHSLRSIAFTQIEVNSEKVNICAIGSNECLYVFKEPIDSVLVNSFDTLYGFKDDINCIEFHSNRPNLMFCGTKDKKIMVWELTFHSNGRLKKNESAIVFQYSAKFSVLSMIYISNYDCLVVAGDSSQLLFFSHISKSKPVIGCATVSRKSSAKMISGLAFIPQNNLLAVRVVNLDYLLVAKLDNILKYMIKESPAKNQPLNLPFTCSRQLQFSGADNGLEFSGICHNSGLLGCGDQSGNVYIYDTNKLLLNKKIDPKIVLNDRLSSTRHSRIVRSVAISSNKRFIVSTTNSGLIGIWETTTYNKTLTSSA